MRLALFWNNRGIVDWLDAIQDQSKHEIVVVVAASTEVREWIRGRSGFRVTDQWEDLLIERDIDAVLAGGSEPEILEVIKHLASSGRALLLIPSAEQGSTFQYELGLIRDENQVRLLPVFVEQFDPVIQHVQSRIEDQSLGKVKLLQWDRSLSPKGNGSTLTQHQIDVSLLKDFALMRRLGGNYDQVTAVRTGAVSGIVMTQTVTVAGRGIPEATWHAQAAQSSESYRLTIHCERGNLILERNPLNREWSVSEPDSEPISGNRLAGIRAFLDNVSASTQESQRQTTDWPECVKAFEMLDATSRSVNRRRTIELHFEPMSERAIFKSQMTAMGCGVLVLTFVLVLAYLAIGSTIPLPRAVLVVLQVIVFAPLGLFLLLQLLFPLARPSTTDGA